MSSLEAFMIGGLGLLLLFENMRVPVLFSAGAGGLATYFFVAKDNPAMRGAELWTTWVWFTYGILAVIGLLWYMFANNNDGPSIGQGGGKDGPHNF
jgi:hypothetical protein